jgi:hypothetical protein
LGIRGGSKSSRIKATQGIVVDREGVRRAAAFERGEERSVEREAGPG